MEWESTPMQTENKRSKNGKTVRRNLVLYSEGQAQTPKCYKSLLFNTFNKQSLYPISSVFPLQFLGICPSLVLIESELGPALTSEHPTEPISPNFENQYAGSIRSSAWLSTLLTLTCPVSDTHLSDTPRASCSRE